MDLNVHSASGVPSGRTRRSFLARTLPAQMLIGLVLGCLIGHFFPTFGKSLVPVRDAFINALRMIVIPLVFASISLGVLQHGEKVGRWLVEQVPALLMG